MMHLTRKKCPKCGSFRIIRKGHHNGSSYWYCKTCNRYSSSRKFLEKKARSPILKSFGLDFSAVLKFTGQQ